MKKVLIDTDIFIDFLRKQEDSKRVFESIINEEIIGFVSVITESELLSGQECQIPEKRHYVDSLLSLVNKVEVDSFIAKRAGEFRRRYNIPLIDSLIAATSVKLNVPIFTRNIKHFKNIKEIRIKKLY